jgi:hypothetical protein
MNIKAYFPSLQTGIQVVVALAIYAAVKPMVAGFIPAPVAKYLP